ncbi:hypothetical protein Dimus_016462 [Dionaea muscipula]
MAGKKRVRFKVPNDNHSPCGNPDAASVPTDAADSSLDDPKTSEYAFFKKLKQDVTKKFHPYPQHKRQLRNGRYTDHMGGEMADINVKNLKPLSHANKAAPTDPGSLISLQLSTFMSPDMVREDGGQLNFNSSSPSKHQTSDCLASFLSPHSSTEVNAGSKHRGGKVFHTKRQTLQKWIKQTLFPENNEPPKGCDLVSLLLLRLLPQRTEFEDSLYPWQFGSDNKLHLPAYPNSNAIQKGNSGLSRMLEVTEECQLSDDDIASDPCSGKLGDMFNFKQTDENMHTCQVGCSNKTLLEYEKQGPFSNGYDSPWSKSFKHQIPSRCFFGSYGSFAACQASATIPQDESTEHRFLNDGFFNHWPHKSNHVVRSLSNYFEVSNPFTASGSSHNLHEPNKNVEDGHLDGDTALRLNTWSLSDYNVSRDEYRSFASIAMQKTDEPIELHNYETGGEPYSLFLGWDVEKPKNVGVFSWLDVSPHPLTLWSKYSQHGLECTVPLGSLCSSSLVSDILVHEPSYMYEDQHLERDDDEDRNFIFEGSGRGLLALSYAPKQIYLSGGCGISKTRNSSSYIEQLCHENFPNVAPLTDSFGESDPFTYLDLNALKWKMPMKPASEQVCLRL